MIRLLSVIMAVLIIASPATVAGLIGPPCEDHPCCCHGPSMDMHSSAVMKIQSDYGCCCQPNSEIPCTLAANPLPNTFEAAVSPSRADIPTPVASGNDLSAAISIGLGDRSAQAMQGGGFQTALPPAYLSHMSFLC